MEKLFRNKTLLSVIAAVLVIAAVIFIPRITGKPAESPEAVSGEPSLAAESSAQDERSLPGTHSEAQTGTSEATPPEESDGGQSESAQSEPEAKIAEDGSYTSREDVALYLRTYGRLPQNFITKSEAGRLGWEGGDLWRYAPGKSIGGDVFGNREGLLPKKSGRTWYECDIDYAGGSRGAKRIVYSDDGLIYYTDDHYETFTELKRG